MIRGLVVLAMALVLAPAVHAANPRVAKPVPSLAPTATAKLWQSLVLQPRVRVHALAAGAGCKPMRAVFYAATDWLRLATKLAANASPCADYAISVPPIVADKTQPRGDQAWRIRALGPSFHALAEISLNAWSGWVATTGGSWHDAGVEARRRMAAAGYDVERGDGWALNEISSAVRRGDGSARANVRDFLRGLYEGDGVPAKGTVFVSGIGQGTTELSVYQARLQDWLEDTAFWTDMQAYVRDWSQELYGDVRNYAVAGADLSTRRDALNAYLQHELSLARAGTAATARDFLEAAYSPLANAAWQYESAFGWTNVPVEEMEHFVSAQTYALRNFGAAAPADHAGFAWAPKNLAGSSSADFTAQTGLLLDRLASAIRDSGVPDAEDPGSGACSGGVWCGGEVAGAWFNEGWTSLATWNPSVLAFTSPPQTLTAGTPSAAISVQLRTFAGVPLPVTSPMPVTLASSSAGGAFSTSATGPWTPTLAAEVPTGSDSLTVYYRDTTAGPGQLTGSADGRQPASQQLTVQPGPLASLAVAPSAVTVPAGGTQQFAVTGADEFGNEIAPSAVGWSLGEGTPGTIDVNGVFTAAETAGTGSIVAAAGGLTAHAAVTVEAPTAGDGTSRVDLPLPTWPPDEVTRPPVCSCWLPPPSAVRPPPPHI